MIQKEYYKIPFIYRFSMFRGRASRKEYLLSWFFHIIFLLVSSIHPPIFGAYYLWSFIPCFALGVRRMHDMGASGWLLYFTIIPIVAPFFVVFLSLKAGDCNENKYGAPTK